MNSNSIEWAIQVGSKWVNTRGVIREVVSVTGAGFGEEEQSVTTIDVVGGDVGTGSNEPYTWGKFHVIHPTWLSDPPGIPVTIGSKWIGSISGTEFEIDELKEKFVLFKGHSRRAYGDTYDLFRGRDPVYLPLTAAKWVPRVGEPALVTGIAEECCADWPPVTSLIGKTPVVRAIRHQVSGKIAYDFAECPVLAHVTLAEPKKETKAGPAFLPKKGDKVRLLELQPGTPRPSSRYKVGDVFTADNGVPSAGAGATDPAWAFIGDADGGFFWGRVELVEAVKAAPHVPKPGDRVKITEVWGKAGNLDSSFFAGRVCTVSDAAWNAPYVYRDITLSDGLPAILLFADDGKCGAYVRCEPAPAEVKLPPKPGKGRDHDELCHNCGARWGGHAGPRCPAGGNVYKEPQVPEVKPPSPKGVARETFAVDVTWDIADFKTCWTLKPSSADRVDAAMAQLGPNARGLLADIADRLVVGKAHGDFEKPADWTEEAYEEDLDGIVYRTMRMRQAKGKAA